MACLRIAPLASAHSDGTRKSFAFGAEVRGVDLNSPSAAQQQAIVSALREHQLLCFPDQHMITPAAEARLARLADPGAVNVWRDQETNPWERFKAERLGGAGTFQLPEHRQTLALGKGSGTQANLAPPIWYRSERYRLSVQGGGRSGRALGADGEPRRCAAGVRQGRGLAGYRWGVVAVAHRRSVLAGAPTEGHGDALCVSSAG